MASSTGFGCDATKKYFCPRLIDYLAIVGSRRVGKSRSREAPTTTSSSPPPPSSYTSVGRESRDGQPTATVTNPQLLRRYPVEDHADFPLPLDMVYFCQPEGK